MKVELSRCDMGFDDLDNASDIDVVTLTPGGSSLCSETIHLQMGIGSKFMCRELRPRRTPYEVISKMRADYSTLLNEIHEDGECQDNYDMRLQFGLGWRGRINRIDGHWIARSVDVLENLHLNQLVTFAEASTRTPTRRGGTG
jgi:hypothetical protein